MILDKKESTEKITILRKAKKNHFSFIEKSMLFDEKISWEAKGVMAYLDADGDIDKVPNNIIKELIDNEYLDLKGAE